MRGKDPDYAQRDLFDAIAKGELPEVAGLRADHAGEGGGDLPHQSV